MRERLGHFQKQEMEEYIACVKKSHAEYSAHIKEATKDALEFLDIDETCYDQSFSLAKASPEVFERLHKREEEVRLEIDRARDLKLTRDQVKEIYMEKLDLDMETDIRLAEVRVQTEEQAQQLVMISRTETMDILYLKHGMKMSDLLRAVSEHDLNDDEDIIQLVAKHAITKEAMVKKCEEEARKEYEEQVKKEEAKEAREV